MTSTSTTIRVTIQQRERLRVLAEQQDASMSQTFDDALEALRRDRFFKEMAAVEARLRAKPDEWAAYTAAADEWLSADLGAV